MSQSTILHIPYDVFNGHIANRKSLPIISLIALKLTSKSISDKMHKLLYTYKDFLLIQNELTDDTHNNKLPGFSPLYEWLGL